YEIRLAIVGVRDRLEIECEKRSLVVAENPAQRGIHLQPATVERYERDADGRVVKCGAKSFLALTQPSLVAPALSDVALDADERSVLAARDPDFVRTGPAAARGEVVELDTLVRLRGAPESGTERRGNARGQNILDTSSQNPGAERIARARVAE